MHLQIGDIFFILSIFTLLRQACTEPGRSAQCDTPLFSTIAILRWAQHKWLCLILWDRKKENYFEFPQPLWNCTWYKAKKNARLPPAFFIHALNTIW